MKSSILRHPALLLLLASLATGPALADPGSCPRGTGASTSAPAADTINTPQFQARMRWIETALREGRITSYEAGRLLRQEWELAGLQQGFLDGARANPSGGCGPLSPDMAARLAPLGNMALEGLQSAGSLMRTLLKETERLIQEKNATGEGPI
ncbi:MAG TPA: hypothetical protein PLL19_05945 [Thiobacillaceae bacterium]|nr:hypothetical protein [Thiobacillaceae bacterium]HNF88854.1 hypothetical protein [Thiobacillaceae bacterium]HNH89267.1 hypothetical protein [Thiobacillaceae bacterium]HNI06993.1 hypothetical protein [Thiobacillaceae bacterium]